MMSDSEVEAAPACQHSPSWNGERVERAAACAPWLGVSFSGTASFGEGARFCFGTLRSSRYPLTFNIHLILFIMTLWDFLGWTPAKHPFRRDEGLG